MEIKEILSQLEYSNTGSFPKEAVEAAVENRDLIIPELLKALEDTTANAEAYLDKSAYFLHIHALYLLAQFKEKKAYPLIYNFFSIPGETTAKLTGDVITEDLSRILACVYDGDTSLIKSLVENPELNEFVRSSALESLLRLALWDDIPMEAFIDYLKALFRGKLSSEDDSYIWTGMTCCAIDIGLTEVQDDITKAFENGLIDPCTIDSEYVSQKIGLDKTKKLKELKESRGYSPIEDTIKELQWWACFKEKKRRTEPEIIEDRYISTPGETFIRTENKVGRNDPCPCGSGKKFKKCCL